MAVLVQVGVNYYTDLKRVEEVTVEVAKEVMREVKGGTVYVNGQPKVSG